MIRISLVGQIGSGKTYVSKIFNLPTFNADKEVSHIYKFEKNCYKKLKISFPNFIKSFPIKKSELIKAIKFSTKNIKIISKIIHPLIRGRLNLFLKRNRSKKAVILDIPLYLENNLNKKNDVIIFVSRKNSLIKNDLIKRKNFDIDIFNKLRTIQLPVQYKKKNLIIFWITIPI